MSLIDGKGLKTFARLIKNYIGIPETLSSESFDVEITSTTDNLDDYTEIGNYYCQSDSVAMTVANCPTTIAFILKVYSGAGRSAETSNETFLTQRLENTNGSIWERYKTTGSWSDWARVGTASSSEVGSGSKPIYVEDGAFVASDSTVGSDTNPVYLNSGEIVASSSSVGSSTTISYLSSGTATASSSTVGSGTRFAYLSSGTITRSSSTVGSASTYPVYLNAGVITRCSANAGNCNCRCQCDCQCTDNDNGY